MSAGRGFEVITDSAAPPSRAYVIGTPDDEETAERMLRSVFRRELAGEVTRTVERDILGHYVSVVRLTFEIRTPIPPTEESPR